MCVIDKKMIYENYWMYEENKNIVHIKIDTKNINSFNNNIQWKLFIFI